MMKGGYAIQTELVRKWVDHGSLQTKAQDVLAVLEARGLEIPAEVRERVLGSTNLAELDQWIRRAAVVSSAGQLFDATTS